MNTNDSISTKTNRAKKMMLWFGMISMSMTFAGLTSAYVVSSSRADWIQQIELPFAFTLSTLLIVLSSGSFYGALRMLRVNKIKETQLLLLVTLGLALAFVYFQFQGFNGIIEKGYYFTGPESSITTSYLYVLVLLHLAHLTAGIVIVLNILFKTLKGVYVQGNTLGFELALTFWHFLDILWVYLFLFVSFYG
ncbi:cytochrome c oxidase subunit 3 [Flavobacteriaceae bacterium]|jgi:cytochrome c oxidase subunit 3|nr:cytochrome c oxidase subunit 3 [Flavobacteriaceae bacterium]MDC0916498.1 cytochrome c oxidase subunit 3 [Flavobacteriaceae bacterium]MDC3329966.1 cytochrome c oxidase subunit 3 [Flavobacteriaceae bacterium]